MNFIYALLVVTASLNLYSCATNCNVEIDMDFRGIPTANDISYQKATSFQDCCNLCTADPTGRCQAWTYVFSTQVCWFKTGPGYRLATTGRVSGVRNTTTTTTTLPSCAVESGYVYHNNDISQPITNIASFSDCCARCGQTAGCVAWSYLMDYKYCYLKNALPALSNRQAYTNSFSGTISTGSIVTTTPAPVVGGTCTTESNVVYQNNDISQPVTLAVGSTQADCCTRCGQTAGCVAWSYLVDYRLCYLKNAAHTAANRINYANTFSGSRTTTTPVTGNTVCTVTSGFIYPGADLTGGGYKDTQTECCNLCGQTAGCVAWDYVPTGALHYCFLKSALPSTRPSVVYQNAYSGIKN